MILDVFDTHNMDVKEARAIGRKYTLLYTFIFYLCCEGVLFALHFLIDIGGGFEGYLKSHDNVDFPITLVLLFVPTFITGRWNGQEILVEHKHYFWTPMKYALATDLIVNTYQLVLYYRLIAPHEHIDPAAVMEGIWKIYFSGVLLFLIPAAILAWVTGRSIRKHLKVDQERNQKFGF